MSSEGQIVGFSTHKNYETDSGSRMAGETESVRRTLFPEELGSVLLWGKSIPFVSPVILSDKISFGCPCKPLIVSVLW
jgi:hypothetical protein